MPMIEILLKLPKFVVTASYCYVKQARALLEWLCQTFLILEARGTNNQPTQWTSVLFYFPKA
jgi:hypothetical protein